MFLKIFPMYKYHKDISNIILIKIDSQTIELKKIFTAKYEDKWLTEQKINGNSLMVTHS